MKLVSWNVRGLGNYRNWRLVRAAIQNCSPDFMVLQETKKEEISDRLVRWSVGPVLSECCAVPAIGTAGRILCLEGTRSMSENLGKSYGTFLSLSS